MKKNWILSLVLLLLSLSLFTGCLGGDEDSGETNSADTKIEITIDDTKLETLMTFDSEKNLSEKQTDIMTDLRIMQGTTNSQAVDSLIDAVLAFENFDIPDIGGVIDDFESIEKFNFVPKRVTELVQNMAEENFDTIETANDFLECIDDAIASIDTAISYNETIVIPNDITEGAIVEITPAHFKLIKSVLLITKGTIQCLMGYNLEVTEAQAESLMSNFEISPRPNTKLGAYIEEALNDVELTDFLSISDSAKLNTGIDTIASGLNVLIEALNEAPTNTLIMFDSDYEFISGEEEYGNTNIFSISTTLKTNLVRDITLLRNAFQGVVTINIMDNSFRINLSVLKTFDIRDEIIDFGNNFTFIDESSEPDFDEEIICDQNFNGLIPDGLGYFIDLFDDFFADDEYEE